MAAAVVSRNPCSGEVVFTGPAGTAGDVADAIGRAAGAAAGWAATSFEDRGSVLRRFADLLSGRAETMAALITREVGKRTAEAAAEVEWAALSARWYAGHPPEPTRHAGATVYHRPLGVIAAVTPWNVPLITPAWKWLPALIAGNTVLWKPSELATGTAAAALDLLRGAGLPDEVLQVLPGGAATAAALCGDERVDGVHFTGSTKAGREIARLVAPRFARCALEMGGVNNALVFANADIAAAGADIVASATAINGQKCTAVRRVLVEERVAADLLDVLGEQVRRLVPGDPAVAATTLGPLVSTDARRRAAGAVAGAIDRGARVVAASPEGPTGSAFFPATVLTGLPRGDELEREELFGPVLTVRTFRDRDAAWHLAGESGYGLCAAVHTRDPAVGTVAAARLPVGILAVNRRSDAVDLEAPFGGRRLSGNGFPEGGSFVYSAVTDLQAVYDGRA